jgi:hypothetical protein
VASDRRRRRSKPSRTALNKAYELNIYNKCTLTAQSNLKELNPNKFPDLQKPASWAPKASSSRHPRFAGGPQRGRPGRREPAKTDKKDKKPEAEEEEGRATKRPSRRRSRAPAKGSEEGRGELR